jgi:hypothetical protein
MSQGIRTCTQKWTVFSGEAIDVINAFHNFLDAWVHINADRDSSIKVDLFFDGNNSQVSIITDEGTRCTYKKL